jgi:hypothetical protein
MTTIASENGWDLSVPYFSDTSDRYASFLGYAGVSSGSQFDPNGVFDRASAAAFVCKLAEFFGVTDLSGTSNFPDVPSSHWAAKYVGYAARIGVASGDSSGRFNPDGRLKNEETILMAYKAYGVWKP